MILLLRLIASLALAQQQQYVPASFRDFSGGINDNLPGIYLNQNESPNAQNMVIDEPMGSIKPRNGITSCGNLPSANPATALFEYFKSDGSRRLIVTDNQTYYQTPDCKTFTQIKVGLSATAYPTFAIVRDRLWVANRSTHVFTWDGSTTTILDGGADTPNPAPPACGYLQFWHERVWCARSDSNPSGVAFSALTNTVGESLDPSTGTQTWPILNLIQVDQNGGSPIYGIKAYRDNLYVFKNNGIWRIIFNNEFDLAVVKTFSSVGTRFHNSIVELDGLLYFVGPDGIYAFDGDNSTRISDKVLNTFQSFKQPLVNDQNKIWTSASDFAAGTLTYVTTGSVSGAVLLAPVTPYAMTLIEQFTDDFSASPSWTQGGGTWSTGTYLGGAVAFNSGGGLEPATLGYIATPSVSTLGRWSFDVAWTGNTTFTQAQTAYEFRFISDGSNFFALRGQGYNLVNQLEWQLIKSVGGVETILSLANARVSIPLGTAMKTVGVIRTSTGAFSFDYDGVYLGSSTDTTEIKTSELKIGAAGSTEAPDYHYYIDNIRAPNLSSTGTIVSDVYNTASVSSWTTFNVTDESNGGSIAYSVKTASAVANLAGLPFSSISPGGIISGSTNNIYVQWQATFSATSNNFLTPRLYDVTLNWTQGGSSAQSIFGSVWKNRYWISASTGLAADSNDTVLVKSKNPLQSWMKYDLQVGPMVKYNDSFYAAASTHSAIYRLDYGTSDNGKAIDAFWETKDETWQLPNTPKSLMEIYADYIKGTASSVNIDYSRDMGITWNSKSLSFTGTGREGKRVFVNGGNSTSYRFRIRSNTLDQNTYSLYGLEGFAIPYNMRGN